MALKGHSDFNRLWFGQTISNLGDKISVLGMPTVAVILLDGGAFEAGVIGALRFMPFLVLGPVAGLLADRMSRRSIMIAADLGRMVALALLPILYMVGHLEMWHLFVVAGTVGVLTTFFEIAYQSWLPTLIGHENLVEGNTKLQISRSVAEAFGAGLGGLFMEIVGVTRAIAIDAGTFLVSLASLLLIRTPDERAKTVESASGLWDDMISGLHTLTRHPILSRLFTSNVLVNFGAAVGDAVLIVFAYKTLGLNPGQVGLAYAVMAAFVIVGAVVSEKITAGLGVGRSIILAGVVLGAGYALVPLTGSALGFTGLIAAQALIGFASPVFDIHVLSLVQTSAPAEQLGRVSGTALSGVYGALAVGNLCGGVLGSSIGLVPALLFAGVVAALGALTLAAGPVASIVQMPAAAEEPASDAEAVTEPVTR